MTSVLSLHPEYDDVLACPNCGSAYTHIDNVEITNGTGQQLRIEAAGEDQHAWLETRSIVDPESGAAEQRRHTIALIGECEGGCGGFRLEFKQHKGQTIFTGESLGS